jgi:hypothetical protein
MQLRREAKKKGRKASKYEGWPEHHSHAEHKEANKKYQKTMERTKRQHWRDWLEKAEDPDIWMAHKYMTSPVGDGGKSRIPILKLTHRDTEQIAATNTEKSTMLAKSFFPPKPQCDTPFHFVYPKPMCNLDPVNKEQVKRNIAKLKPFKAQGPDGILNIVLIKCTDILLNRLFYIYTAMIERRIYYDPWKQSTTVVLHKPGKPCYNTPKAYHPIALLNKMSKVLTAIMSELLIF